MLIYKEMSIRGSSTNPMGDAWSLQIRVLFIISAAGIFGWLLIHQKVPEAVVNGLLSLSKNPWVVLLIINIILLVLGCFMEGISVMLLTIPVFMPVITKLGIDPGPLRCGDDP